MQALGYPQGESSIKSKILFQPCQTERTGVSRPAMTSRTMIVIFASGIPSIRSWQGMQAKQHSSNSAPEMFRRFLLCAKESDLSRQHSMKPSSQLMIPARSNSTFIFARKASHAAVRFPTRFMGLGFFVEALASFLPPRSHGFLARNGVRLVSELFQLPIFLYASTDLPVGLARP